MNEKNEDQPLVSVVIPCYNHEQFVQEAIQSVIDQDYINIELLIIDDGSKDSSVEKIEELIPVCEQRFNRFEFKSRVNKGISATLNEGVAWANGDFFTICASDDSFHRNKIKAQVDYFKLNKDSDFCYTGVYVYDDVGTVLEKITQSTNNELHSKISFDDILTFKKHFPVSGAYRLKLIKDKLGGFDENLSAEDYDIYLKIFSCTRIGFIKEKLFYYRSPAAIGGSRRRYAMRIDVSESHFKTINKYKNHPSHRVAIAEWNFRRFIYFASYKKTKIYAVKGMFKSLKKMTDLSFLKAAVRLVFYWK